MKNFNMNRFWQVLKWNLLTEKKSISTAAIAFLVGFLCIQLFSCFTLFDLSQGLGEGATLAGMITCVTIISVLLIPYYVTGILGNARTKQQRTTALTLPASNMEKFLARIIYCCIFMPLLLIVALVAATCLRMLMEMIFGHEGIISGFQMLSEHFAPNYDSLTAFVGSIWMLSLFVLGGVFYRHRPFIWTSVTLVAASLLLVTMGFYFGTMIGENGIRRLAMNFSDLSFETFDLIVSLILAAFTALNFWLSYWLFCKLQIVQHKWFNV